MSDINYILHIADLQGIGELDTGWLHPNELQVFEQKKRNVNCNQFFASRCLMKQVCLGPRSTLWPQHCALYDKTLGMINLCTTANLTVNRFSLSHSHQYVAALQCADNIAGVDVQYHSKTAKQLKQLQTLLSDSDQQQIAAKKYTFYQIWVIKEAYAKLSKCSIFDVLKLPISTMIAHNFVRLIPVNDQVELAIVLTQAPTTPLHVVYWGYTNNLLQTFSHCYENWHL